MSIRPVFFIPPVSDIMVWLDAADTNNISPTPTDGSAISQWSDKSGRGNHATQTGTARPTWNASSRSISFSSASSQFFNLPSNAFPAGNTSYAYYMVVNIGAITNSAPTPDWTGFVGGGTYGTTNNVFALRTANSPNTNSLTTYWWNNDLSTASSSVSAGTRYLILTDYDSGGTRRIIMNGGTQSVSDTPGTRSQTTGNNTVGRAWTNQFLEGTMSELIVFNRRLTAAEQQSVETYLARKWGLTGWKRRKYNVRCWWFR